MSDEAFLKRWSRKKRAEGPDTERADPETAAPEPRSAPTDSPRPVVPERSDPAAESDEAIDPATLPPLDSLGPDSDYTAFLKKGVPEATRIAALRKAWITDPFIRDHRGPAEYALDYTTKEFDLLPTDDVAKMLDRIFPARSSAEKQHPPAPAEQAQEPAAGAPEKPRELSLPQERAEPVPIAPANETAVPTRTPARRRHGGALPDEPS